MVGIDRAAKEKLLAKMRKKQQESAGNRDSTEWRVDKVKEGEEAEYRLAILPPLDEGETCTGGTAGQTQDLWYLANGAHWINKKRVECPRVHLENGTCPLCDMGFDLMQTTDDKKVRSQIAKEWLSRQNWAVNVYFLNHKTNPEHLRGKVMWWNVPKAVFEVCDKAFNSNDPGDEDDPRAFGYFCDPTDAFPLIVTVTEKNGYNNYESSRLLGRSKPIADDEEEIMEILDQRHDLYTKFKARDVDRLTQILNEKLGDETGSDGFDDDDTDTNTDDTEDNTVEEAKVEEEKPKTRKKAKAEPKPEPEDEPASTPVEDEETGVDDPELASLLAELNDDED
jgi:hypothetical protein